MIDEFRERWEEVVAADGLPAFQIELLRHFVSDFPDSGGAWRWLGRSLEDISRFDEARQPLQRALELVKPENRVLVLCDFGRLCRHMGDLAEAEEWFRKAITEYPRDTQGYILLGGMF